MLDGSKHLFKWLLDENNRGALITLFMMLSAVFGAAWTVYAHFSPLNAIAITTEEKPNLTENGSSKGEENSNQLLTSPSNIISEKDNRDDLGKSTPDWSSEQRAASIAMVADLAFESGNFSLAVSKYREAVQIAPRYVYQKPLVEALYRSGQRTEALVEALVLVEIAKEEFEPSSLEVAGSYNSLGIVYWGQNLLEEAEQSLQVALQAFSSAGLKGKEGKAGSLQNLALVQKSLGDYEQAFVYQEEALKIKEALYGVENSDYARGLANLADYLDSLGRYSEAEEKFKQSITIQEAVTGRQHPDFAIRLSRFADFLVRQKRGGEANELSKEALGIFKAFLGESHPRYISALSNLSRSLRILGKTDEALSISSEVLRLYEKYMDDHISGGSFAHYLFSHGQVLEANGDCAKALKFYRTALDRWIDTEGKDGPNTTITSGEIERLADSC